MSSLLTFAMKRQKATNSSSTDNNNVPSPQVTPSSSGEMTNEADEVRDSSFYTAEAWSLFPQTPEGLRPRQSVNELREQLDIPQPRVALPLLPPRHANNIQSPQVSNSSFYTSTTNGTLVAESPELSIGRARTAVGALVAQHQQQPRPSVHFERSDVLGVLPPRDWLVSKTNDEEETPYQRLDDSLDLATPNRAPRSFMSVSPGSTADASSIHASSSTHASPLTWRHYQQYQDENYTRSSNLSFSSRLCLVEDGENRGYNFDPIDESPDDKEFVVAATDQLNNVSGISQNTSTGPSEKWTWGISDDRSLEEFSGQSFNGQDAMDSALLHHKAANQRRNKERQIIDLVQRLQDDTSIVADVDDTMRNEDTTLNCMFLKTPMDCEGLLTGYAREKRLRLLNTIAKLLHEMEVAYPEEFFMSPTQIPIMADTHHDLRQALGFLHCIIRTAIPENERDQGRTDKFSSDLAQAGPKPRWTAKSWLRSSLGIQSIPESPETVRGGDTSLFSLPTESCDTPHTSNVSMATTITSRNSPLAGVSSPSPRQTSKIRRTIEIAATLVQKLTTACNQLLQLEHCSSMESIRATEDIKRNYLQLMSLSLTDVSALVSAFAQEVPQMSLARIVSEDDMDQDAPAKSKAPVMTSRELAPSRPLLMAEMDSSISVCDSRMVSFNEDPSRDFFSPRTEDMNSNTLEEEDCNKYQYVDDLRRDQGSYDYEERGNDCERDGPPEDSCSGDEFSQLYGRIETGAFPSMPMHCETITRSPMKEI